VKTKTARILLLVCYVIIVLLMVICAQTNEIVWGYAGIAFAFIGAGIWIAFGRCKSCGNFLGRINVKFCPHCGKEVDWK